VRARPVKNLPPLGSQRGQQEKKNGEKGKETKKKKTPCPPARLPAVGNPDGDRITITFLTRRQGNKKKKKEFQNLQKRKKKKRGAHTYCQQDARTKPPLPPQGAQRRKHSKHEQLLPIGKGGRK
jgi:hypothetical protein